MSENGEQWCRTTVSRVPMKCWCDASNKDAECNSQELIPVDSRKHNALAYEKKQMWYSNLAIHGQERPTLEEE